MSAKLNTDDSCLVDMLLERSTTQGINSCFTEAASSEVRERLTHIEQILHRLDLYTVPEPPENLVARTVERCEGRAKGRSGEIPAADPLTLNS